MQLGIEKIRPKHATAHATPNPEVRKTQEISARMHFYAVHNAGEQLRYASLSTTGKKPDRMVGR